MAARGTSIVDLLGLPPGSTSLILGDFRAELARLAVIDFTVITSDDAFFYSGTVRSLGEALFSSSLNCPNAGAGRSLRIATTTVIFDDVLGFIGSTALSRRGLSHDSSLSIAGFDEVCTAGRGESLAALRRLLVAARLGLPPTLVPDDGAALVRAIAALVARGSGRLTTAALPVVDPPVTDSDRALWDRDGTVAPDPADLAAWLAALGPGTVLN